MVTPTNYMLQKRKEKQPEMKMFFYFKINPRFPLMPPFICNQIPKLTNFVPFAIKLHFSPLPDDCSLVVFGFWLQAENYVTHLKVATIYFQYKL